MYNWRRHIGNWQDLYTGTLDPWGWVPSWQKVLSGNLWKSQPPLPKEWSKNNTSSLWNAETNVTIRDWSKVRVAMSVSPPQCRGWLPTRFCWQCSVWQPRLVLGPQWVDPQMLHSTQIGLFLLSFTSARRNGSSSSIWHFSKVTGPFDGPQPLSDVCISDLGLVYCPSAPEVMAASKTHYCYASLYPS